MSQKSFRSKVDDAQPAGERSDRRGYGAADEAAGQMQADNRRMRERQLEQARERGIRAPKSPLRSRAPEDEQRNSPAPRKPR